MTAPAALLQRVKELLAPLSPAAVIFDGGVPDNVPVIPGTTIIKPYVVIWPGIGSDPDEQPIGWQVGQNLIWQGSTTIASATATSTMNLAADVRHALHKQDAPGAGIIREVPPFRPVAPDNTVKPARFFVPLFWEITTAF